MRLFVGTPEGGAFPPVPRLESWRDVVWTPKSATSHNALNGLSVAGHGPPGPALRKQIVRAKILRPPSR
jgi:hypothetical protein